jgi:hypothetical protein
MARSTLGKLLLNPFGLGVIGGVASKAQGGTFREGFEQGVQGDLGDAMSSTKGLLGQAKDKLTNQDDFDGINAKLDKLLEASGGGGETVNAASVIGGQQPQQPLNPSALAMKVNSFMESSQQSPYSNNTGGKKSKSASRMMAVADPEEDTKNSLFKQS